MKASLFIELTEKWFSSIKKSIEQKINGKIEAGEYLHEQVLTREYTEDLSWESSGVNDSIVAADVVSQDSPLSLKKRGTIEKASGSIVKTGMKKALTESQIKKLNVLMSLKKGVQMIAKLFEDAPKCALGIKERVEMMFLEGISTGYTTVGGVDGDQEKGDNTGVEVRVSFGFLDKNKFGASIVWGKEGYTPISDILRVLAGSEATINIIWLSKQAYSLMRNSEEAKRLYANFRSIPIQADSILPTPTKSQFNEAFDDEYGITFKLIDREVITEKNGKKKTVNPFDKDTLVFLTQDANLGRVMYSDLAEESHPVTGVTYEKVDEYILISKFAKNEPLREYTAAQAFVLPVIDGASDICLLNIKEAQEVAADEVEDDANITIYGQSLVKADVMVAVKSIGVSCASNISDATLIKKINELSGEQELNLKEALGIE